MKPALSLTVRPRLFGSFLLLLQQGFLVRAHGGSSVEKLLRTNLGISPEYIAERITTIVLDGSVVDDLASAHIGSGSTIALSGSLPGLVGATLRRGGTYASLRKNISHRDRAVTGETTEIIVKVKLFNTVLEDHAPRLLREGLLVSAGDLSAHLSSFALESSDQQCKAALDGKDLPLASVAQELLSLSDVPVLLSVTVA